MYGNDERFEDGEEMAISAHEREQDIETLVNHRHPWPADPKALTRKEADKLLLERNAYRFELRKLNRRSLERRYEIWRRQWLRTRTIRQAVRDVTRCEF